MQFYMFTFRGTLVRSLCTYTDVGDYINTFLVFFFSLTFLLLPNYTAAIIHCTVLKITF